MVDETKQDQETPSADEFIAYLKALRILEEKWQATPEELAMWIFMGKDDGGLDAYVSTHKQQARFSWASCVGRRRYLDVLAQLYFRRSDIEQFVPDDRYITGNTLMERWGKIPGVRPKAYIQAKIRESRLLDMHPTCGFTRFTDADGAAYSTCPPLKDGLFSMQWIKQIEEEDGIVPHIPVADPDHLTKGVTPTQGIAKGTRAEVAQALGVSCSSLDRYFKMKSPLPHSKEEGLTIVDTDKGKQWIEDHQKKVKTKRAKNIPKKQRGTR